MFAGGGLKLKGHANDDKVKKKKKRSKKDKISESAKKQYQEQDRRDEDEEHEEPVEKEQERGGRSGGGHDERRNVEGPKAEGPRVVKTKTAAELNKEKLANQRLQDKIEKMAGKSHKDRVNEFNTYLSRLSEHHDIPRVGPG